MANNQFENSKLGIHEAVNLLQSWVLEDQFNRYIELQGDGVLSFVKDKTGQWETFEAADTLQELAENMQLNTML